MVDTYIVAGVVIAALLLFRLLRRRGGKTVREKARPSQLLFASAFPLTYAAYNVILGVDDNEPERFAIAGLAGVITVGCWWQAAKAASESSSN